MVMVTDKKFFILNAVFVIYLSHNLIITEGKTKTGVSREVQKTNSHEKVNIGTKPVKNTTETVANVTATSRECLPFIPPCPCAHSVHQGPICSADVQLGFVVPVSSRQPIVHIEVSRFVQSIVSRFHLSPQRTQVGVVTYGTTPKMSFSFNRFSCKRKVLHQLNHLSNLCPHGRPRVGKALTYADHHMFHSKSHKSKVLVVVTEKSSCDDVLTPAKALRSNNVRILTVGVGRYIDGKQLDEIANKPLQDNIFNSDLSYLHIMTDKIVKNICFGAGGFLEQKKHKNCLCTRPHHEIL